MINCLLTYFLAVLTGDVKMSAERRLMIHTHSGDNNVPKGESKSIDIVKEK